MSTLLTDPEIKELHRKLLLWDASFKIKNLSGQTRLHEDKRPNLCKDDVFVWSRDDFMRKTEKRQPFVICGTSNKGSS